MFFLIGSLFSLGLASARVQAYNHYRTWARYAAYRNIWYKDRILGIALVYGLINTMTAELKIIIAMIESRRYLLIHTLNNQTALIIRAIEEQWVARPMYGYDTKSTHLCGRYLCVCETSKSQLHPIHGALRHKPSLGKSHLLQRMAVHIPHHPYR